MSGEPREVDGLRAWLRASGPVAVWGSGVAGKLLLLALLLLVPGLFMPVMTLDSLGADPASYSIVAGIWRLFEAEKFGLGLLILGFSVVFPLIKLGLLLRYCQIQSLPFDHRWLLWLGKWSMLDLFVVAVIIGAGRLKMLSSFSAEPGIYWFAAAVALSMVGAELLLNAPEPPAAQESPPARRRWFSTLLPLSSLGIVVVGLSLPLLKVSKWVFWSNDYSLALALPRMWIEGEWLLPIVLAATVIFAPAFALLCSTGYYLTGAGRMLKLTTAARRWSMLNVFVLSLLVVMIKLGDKASVSAQPGIWLLTAGAVLATLDGWLVKRGWPDSQPPGPQSGQ